MSSLLFPWLFHGFTFSYRSREDALDTLDVLTWLTDPQALGTHTLPFRLILSYNYPFSWHLIMIRSFNVILITGWNVSRARADYMSDLTRVLLQHSECMGRKYSNWTDVTLWWMREKRGEKGIRPVDGSMLVSVITPDRFIRDAAFHCLQDKTVNTWLAQK